MPSMIAGLARPGQAGNVAEVVCWSTGPLGMSRPVYRCTVCVCNPKTGEQRMNQLDAGKRNLLYKQYWCWCR